MSRAAARRRPGGTALGEGALAAENRDSVKFAYAMMPLMHRPSEILAAELRKGGEAHKVLPIAAVTVYSGSPHAAHINASDCQNVLEVAQKNAQASHR